MVEVRRFTTGLDGLEAFINTLACGAPSVDISDELRSKFTETERQLTELQTTADKMRKKCHARVELEQLKASLTALLPDSPAEPVKVAEHLVEQALASPEVCALLERAQQLEGQATYGAKMSEKVLDLLQRFDVATSRFSSELQPRFGAAVAAGNAEDAQRRAAAEAERREAERAETQRLKDEHKSAVRGLVDQNEQRLQAQREAELEQARKLAEEEKQERLEREALEAEEAALRASELEGEKYLLQLGPNGAIAKALQTMLTLHIGVYRQAIESLTGIFGAIASEPGDIKLRVFRTSNETFRQHIGRRVGCWLFLRGAGFQARTRDDLPARLVTHLGLPSGPSTERFLVLDEPDMAGDYEAWVAWHTRLRSIAGFVQELERLAFNRTAHLGRHGADVVANTVLQASEVLQQWERCAS